MTLSYFGPSNQNPAGYVTQSVPCAACGTDLLGLHVTHRCSKCGLPTGRTVQPRLLHFAPPDWLKNVRSGLLVLFWGTIILFGLSMLVGLVIAVIAGIQAGKATTATTQGAFVSTWEADSQPTAGGYLAMGISGLIAGIILAVGAWRVTTPDRGPGASPVEDRNASLARIFLVAGLVCSAITIPMQNVTSVVDPPIWVRLLTAIASLVQAAGFLFLAKTIAGLAARIPDLSMTSRIRTCGWAVAICTVVVGLAAIATPPTTSTPSPAAIGFGLATGVVGLAMLVFYIIYLIALFQLAGRFKQAGAYSAYLLQQPLGVPAIAAQPMSEQEPLP